jgi:hypothetical protein
MEIITPEDYVGPLMELSQVAPRPLGKVLPNTLSIAYGEQLHLQTIGLLLHFGCYSSRSVLFHGSTWQSLPRTGVSCIYNQQCLLLQ